MPIDRLTRHRGRAYLLADAAVKVYSREARLEHRGSTWLLTVARVELGADDLGLPGLEPGRPVAVVKEGAPRATNEARLMLYLSGFTAAVASVLEQPIVAVVAAVILVLSGILLQVLAPSNFVDLPELVRAVRTVALDGDRRADAPYLGEIRRGAWTTSKWRLKLCGTPACVSLRRRPIADTAGWRGKTWVQIRILLPPTAPRFAARSRLALETARRSAVRLAVSALLRAGPSQAKRMASGPRRRRSAQPLLAPRFGVRRSGSSTERHDRTTAQRSA